MVQDEISSKSKNQIHYKMANVYDRMAAFVVDFSLIFFIHSFISFYFKSKQSQAFLEGFDASFFYWASLSIISFFVLYFLYHMISLHYFHKTLGKKIFHIRCLDVWTHKKASLHQVYKYSFWKSIGLITLGIPFLSVFYDRKRRAFHEKLSDTACFTTKNRYQLAPNKKELQFIKGFVLPFQVLAIFSLIGALYYIGNEVNRYESLSVLDMDLEPSCESLNSYESYNHHSRLETAFSLYLLDQVESECLEVEAQSAMENHKDLDLAYLAFSFLRPQKQSEYLTKACESSNYKNYCNNEMKLDASNLELLLAAKKNLKEKKYKEAYQYMQAASGGVFQGYLEGLKLKALYFLNKKEEIHFALKHLKHSIVEEAHIGLSAWLCAESMKKSCDTNHPACKELAEVRDFSSHHRKSQIAYVDMKVCLNSQAVLPIGVDPSLEEYYNALWIQKNRGDMEPLREMAISNNYPLEIRTAALEKLKYESNTLNPLADNKKEIERKPASEEN